MKKALSHLRVLDMSRVLAGPFLGQNLADFGADVIKVERPHHGDETRTFPPYLKDADGEATEDSAYFMAINRGKRSVTIDIATPRGQALIKELAAKCDVLIENYKVGTLAGYGLSYDDLAAVNPRLIGVSVTGFGQTGPYRHRPGYDTIIQAMGGMMSITGERDGQPGAGPQRAGLPVIDLMTGVYAALGVMAALRERERTGRGQHIDLALLDVHVSILSYFGMNYLASGQLPVRTGVANPVTYPSGTFACADGQVVLITGNDAQFRRFAQLLGQPQLADDERFRTSGVRVRHRDTLHELIAPTLRSRSAAEWVEALEAIGVPCGPINDLAAVLRDPQVCERGLVTRIAHPTLGEIPLLGNPLRMSAAPMRYDVAPPVLGANTDEILRRDVGLDENQIARLRELGVI